MESIFEELMYQEGTMLERQLEDYICAHPEVLHRDERESIEILGRQIRVPHGIIDLLVWRNSSWLGRTLHGLYLIELKRPRVKEKHVIQLLRYRADLMRILRDMTWPYVRDGPTGDFDRHYRDCWYDLAYDESHPNRWLGLWIIGPAISERAASVCRDNYIWFSRWYSIDGEVQIERSSLPKPTKCAFTKQPRWLTRLEQLFHQAALGGAIQSYGRERGKQLAEESAKLMGIEWPVRYGQQHQEG